MSYVIPLVFRSIGQKHIVTETTGIQGIPYILRSGEVHSYIVEHKTTTNEKKIEVFILFCFVLHSYSEIMYNL